MAAIAKGNVTIGKTTKYIIGKCLPSWKSNAAKIQIPSFEFDQNLLMHFRRLDYVYAHDPYKLCKSGDMVLISTLPEKMTRLITHKVVEVVFPLGDFTDPITGKKVVGSKYREDIKEVNELYGKSETAYDYDKAPPRGHLEDVRDFTHKPSYKKYHDDPDDPQPYAQ